MTRVLVLFYSQSGDGARAIRAFMEPLGRMPDMDIVQEEIRPLEPYPYPWRSVRRFFDVMPECVLGIPCRLHPPTADLRGYDLVVLGYPVWFLMPALPVQSFLKSGYATCLKDANVVTIVTSRNMWCHASEWAKSELHRLGARHRDNISITHSGPVWATFITTPRALIFGKRTPLCRCLPPAGIGDRQLERLHVLGSVAAQRLSQGAPVSGPLLSGQGAVQIEKRSILPEFVGWYFFRGWARLLRHLGIRDQRVRTAGIYAFVLFLILLILIGIPFVLAVAWLIRPLLRRRIDRYAARLAEPSGE